MLHPASGDHGGVSSNQEDARTSFERAVVDALLDLRTGEVASYGGLAADAGYPGRARAVGTSDSLHTLRIRT